MANLNTNKSHGPAELTVGVLAHNCENSLGQTIESILKQGHVSFELIIVDDGSDDKTSDLALSFKNPRVKMIQNPRQQGYASCQNIIIRQSLSPYITFLKGHQIVLPGALNQMVETLRKKQTIGQVYCYCLDMNGQVTLSRNDIRKRKRRIIQRETSSELHHHNISTFDVETFGLRTYRREAFDHIGFFHEGQKHQYDNDMTLRMLARYETHLIPKLLCWTKRPKAKGFKWIHQQLESLREIIVMALPFGIPKNSPNGHIRVSPIRRVLLVPIRRIGEAIWRARKTKWRIQSQFKNFIRQYIQSMGRSLYTVVVQTLSRWPIRMWKSQATWTEQRPTRVGYYLWQFPVLSQTFIDREVRALRNAGVFVEVVADKHGDIQVLDHPARTLIDSTTYIFPIDNKVARQYVSYFFFRSPISFINLFVYVVGQQYQKHKFFQEDVRLFFKAVYLAGLLKDKKITGVHSPWANRTAFVSLIASQLLHVPFTIQARASDIHRRSDRYALEKKFSHAQMVLTNTRFNQNFLRQFLPEKERSNIQVIYNGIDLAQFVPTPPQERDSRVLNLLSVARLIEPKGLIYLLKACRFLKDKKFRFHCEIIGGSQDTEFAYFVRLKTLHRELGLENLVTFSGAQPFSHVLRRYQTADIFILPCVQARDGSQDITPNALIEAMAMKLSVISTQSTAIPEIVDDGVNGLLVPPKNDQALAEALMKLMNDGQLRARLGEQARRKIELRFDSKKNVTHWVECFEGKRRNMKDENVA